MELGKTGEEAWAPFACIQPCPFDPFRDATYEDVSALSLPPLPPTHPVPGPPSVSSG